jgi:hypothetical protein
VLRQTIVMPHSGAAVVNVNRQVREMLQEVIAVVGLELFGKARRPGIQRAAGTWLAGGGRARRAGAFRLNRHVI